MFYGCNSIKKFCVPSGITTIKGSLLNACYNLERILIPKNITSIDASAFGFCYKMKIYDFRNFEAVPTLGSNAVFNKNNKLAKIIVPDALYSTWISAQYWSNLSSQIVKASEA